MRTSDVLFGKCTCRSIAVYISETNSIVVYTTYREKAVSEADGLEETYGGVRWNDF